MKERTFALDLAFDWNVEGNMRYSFSERCGPIQVPASWQALKPQNNRISMGEPGDESYLRIAVWGEKVDPAKAILSLKLRFAKGANAPCSQERDSPFGKKVTKYLKKGIPLGGEDAFYYDGTTTVWIVDPRRAGLSTAHLRERDDSVLWFNYFPKMSHGAFELSVVLDVHKTRRFCFDPEMEVGEDDGDPGPDGLD